MWTWVLLQRCNKFGSQQNKRKEFLHVFPTAAFFLATFYTSYFLLRLPFISAYICYSCYEPCLLISALSTVIVYTFDLYWVSKLLGILSFPASLQKCNIKIFLKIKINFMVLGVCMVWIKNFSIKLFCYNYKQW